MRWTAIFLTFAAACGPAAAVDSGSPLDAGPAADAGFVDTGPELEDAAAPDLGVDAGQTDLGAHDSGQARDPTRFVAIAPMSQGSSNHTATVLVDGRVLIAGGMTYTGRLLARSEIWDPTADRWTEVPDQEARANHTATLLHDGRVLIAGGGRENSIGAPAGRGVLATAILFDPATDTFTETASMSVPRSHHTATLLPDGRVWIIGGSGDTTLVQPGFGDALGTSELWDPSTGRWSSGPTLQIPRYLHSAVRLGSGEIAIAAGGDPTEAELPEVELLALGQPTSRLGPTMSSGRVFQAAAMLPSGAWLVVAGKQANIQFLRSAEILAPDGARFTSATPIAGESRTAPTLTRLDSGRVLLTGGLHGSAAGFYQLADAMLYDEAPGAWSVIGPLAEARVLHTASLLQDGTVLVCGGLDATSALASCERAVP